VCGPTRHLSYYTETHQLPLITGVSSSGCGATTINTNWPGNPLAVADCTSNATLTLTGSNLNGTFYSTAAIMTSAFSQSTSFISTVVSNTSTQIVLQLPDINNTPTPIVTDTPYQFVINMSPPNYLQSNMFLVSFATTSVPSDTPTSSSSSGLSSGAIAGIVVAAVVAALICTLLAVMLLRRVRAAKRASGGGENGFWSIRPRQLQEDSGSETMRGVELQ